MYLSVVDALRGAVAVRFRLSRDLAAVALSWLLVVGCLATATFVFTAANGIGYFLLYAVLGAGLVGVGVPLYWTVVVRRRPVADLGITRRRLWLSLALQGVFAALLAASGAYRGVTVPEFGQLLPLVGLALAIGFFEAVFWRGWVLLRLEESFGFIPALLLGSLLYAAYHIGYGMGAGEMAFLFFIGIMYAVAFRLTRSVFILWPVFQPMGQLATLFKDGLELPTIAILGFVEVLALMFVLVWLAERYYRRRSVARPPASL